MTWIGSLLVGVKKWMAKLCKPFSKADVRYFEILDIKDAWAGLFEGEGQKQSS